MRADMSTSEPRGTWQYPHSVCCPAGARLGSTTPAWAIRQNGRSGWRPAATSASDAATSANVPPTCTVPASRQAGACQGTGPLSAQSTLQTPGPYRNRCSARRDLAGSRSPASATNWRGVTSSSTARAFGRSRSDVTQRPVSIRPPSEVSSVTSASVSLALPPSTKGQPTECAIIRNSRPKELVSGLLSGSIVCAAAPASRLFASSPRNRRASTLAGSRPSAPNLAIASGWAGNVRPSGPSTVGRISGRSCASGPSSRRYVRASGPSSAAVSSTDPVAATARPPSSGWAKATFGVSSLTPKVARSVPVKNGDALASGCTAEQTSCQNPGSVSSSVLQPPPGVAAPSMTCTDRPALAMVSAAASPFGPEPTTTASTPSELKDLALRGHDHFGQGGTARHLAVDRGDPAGHLVERGVGAAGLVMGQHDPPRPGPPAEPDRVVDRRVAEEGLGGDLVGEQERVVQQHVGAARELERGGVILAPPLWSRPERRGAVVGQVRDHARPVADPVTERRAALVRYRPRLDREALGLQLPGRDGAEGPRAAQLARPDREVRRRHALGQRLLRAGAVVLLGQQQADPRSLAVAAGEERQPVHVIPVQVSEQDRAIERLAAEQRRDLPQAGAGVEDQRRPGRAVVRDRHARGVPAVTEEVGAGRRGRTANPTEIQAHSVDPMPGSGPGPRLPCDARRTALPAPAGRTGPRRPRPPGTGSPPPASRSGCRPRGGRAPPGWHRGRTRPAAPRPVRPGSRRRAAGRCRPPARLGAPALPPPLAAGSWACPRRA